MRAALRKLQANPLGSDLQPRIKSQYSHLARLEIARAQSSTGEIGLHGSTTTPIGCAAARFGDVSPSLSPDGNKIVFVSNRSGSPQIYVRDLLRGREERLTFEGKYNTSPSWSSLNRIAYAGMTDGKFDIYTMEADGSHLMKLTADQGNNEDPCWSPDGRYIAFASSREGQYHVYIMNANGQNQRRITYGKGDQTSPSWSPY